ncbi:MAG: hypothetical protein M1821_006621 [Bathelium mastoideum]|nr:MAG: hypothetical protein M1821_006621 [Bathelium mastoideum]
MDIVVRKILAEVHLILCSDMQEDALFNNTRWGSLETGLGKRLHDPEKKGNFGGIDARNLISDVATRLRLFGFITVGSNGLPEGEAQGDEGKLNDLIRHIKGGLPAGEVTGVECTEIRVKSESLIAECKNKLFGGGFKIM